MNLKRKKIVQKMVENGCSLGRAMRMAGYSYAYSRNPQKITRTKFWKESMENMFNDEELIEKTKELLAATHQVHNSNGEIIGTLPNYNIQLRALDMIYRLKGKYKPTKIEVTNPYQDLSTEEIDQRIELLESELNRK